MDKFKRWFGLEKRSEYVNAYFDTANFRSSIYMSVVIIILEVWMIVSLLRRWIGGDPTRSQAWFVEHFISYMIFLLAAACMLIYAVNFLRGRFKDRLPGKIILICFSLVSLSFGINISYSDYCKGEQILCFVMMIIFTVGLINWRPIVSILASSTIFLIFFEMMKHAPGIELTYATKVNYFTLWISVVMLSLAVYAQRLSEAEKDEILENSSIRDELTGIPNMFFFRKRASEIIAEEGIENKLFLYLDIANFKAFNEKYGFDAGTEFIRTTAKKVAHYFENDLYARISDDHFVILTDAGSIETRLKQLTDEVGEDHTSTQLTLKAGGYVPKDISVDPTIACDHARYACSTIKKRFDRFYCEYDSEMDDGFHKRQYIITHVNDAVKNGYIKVYYQPVVLAEDRSLCGVEALARWNDPNYGFLSPGDFIPALEEYRLIQRLDRAILEQVCKDLQAAISTGKKIVPVSVNFSRLDFEMTDVKEMIRDLTERYNVPADHIHVEITESALTVNDENLKDTVALIKNMGIQLWLDDFGSGYSSLNVLKDYTFDVMKIDMVFLRRFKENEKKSKSILNSIVTMANLIDMETLSEGVETEEQAEFLKEIGCKRLQGYLFGKPMPIEELSEKFCCF